MELSVVLRDVSGKTGKGNIKIKIKKKGEDPTFIPTTYYIKPAFFDPDNGIIKKEFQEAAKWNSDLFAQKSRYETYYKELGDSVKNASVKTLKQLFVTYDNINSKSQEPLKSVSDFIGVISKQIEDLKNEEAPEELKRSGYASTFEGTKNLMIEFFKSEIIHFQSIDRNALIQLKAYFLKYKGKEVTFNKHLRNIKRIFNIAIGDGLISADLYPFRNFKIPSDYDTEIRCIEAGVLKQIYDTTGIGRDFLFLSFFLCGMNMKDIFYMPYFERGIDVKRLKTFRKAGNKVKLKLTLQPEIIEIINRYADSSKTRLIKTLYTDRATLLRIVNESIRESIDKINNKRDSKDKIQYFTFAYARHSWATIAGKLRIPDETIDKAQMRSSQKVIEKYREYDYTQVDEANRKVIDYVLYEKTGE